MRVLFRIAIALPIAIFGLMVLLIVLALGTRQDRDLVRERGSNPSERGASVGTPSKVP
jgi:hypothetical protein